MKWVIIQKRLLQNVLDAQKVLIQVIRDHLIVIIVSCRHRISKYKATVTPPGLNTFHNLIYWLRSCLSRSPDLCINGSLPCLLSTYGCFTAIACGRVFPMTGFRRRTDTYALTVLVQCEDLHLISLLSGSALTEAFCSAPPLKHILLLL